MPMTSASTPHDAGRRCQARPLSRAIRPGPVITRHAAPSPSTPAYSIASPPRGPVTKKPLPSLSSTALIMMASTAAAASGVNRPTTRKAPATSSVTPVTHDSVVACW